MADCNNLLSFILFNYPSYHIA